MNLVLTYSSVEYAKAMSAALWSLARPVIAGSTRYAVGWIQHSGTGAVALQIGEYKQRVDPDADIEAFVAALPIPQDEATALLATLESARGQSLTVAQWLPPSLMANTLTDQQMIDQGWWPEEAL